MKLRAFSFSVTVMLCVAVAVCLVAGADKEASLTTDMPGVFQLYSEDGRRSVHGYCVKKAGDVITCSFNFVEFLPPEVLHPKRPVQDSQKQEFGTEEMEKGRKEFCSGTKAGFETMMRDPQIGPKRKKHFQQILEACSAKDPQVLFDSLTSLEKRTCGLRVVQLSLDFRKIGKGQWFSDGGGPQGLCNVVRNYVLKQEGEYPLAGWTLTETTVAGDTKSPLCKLISEEELNKPTVWRFWNTYKEFELPCDFVQPTYIMPEAPRVR